VAIAAEGGDDKYFKELKTLDGKVYRDVHVRGTGKDYIIATWDGGRGMIRSDKLPDDVLRQLGLPTAEERRRQKELEQKRKEAEAKRRFEADEKFEAAQRAKGLVKYEGKWLRREEAEKRRRQEQAKKAVEDEPSTGAKEPKKAPMKERRNLVTMQGAPLTLLGPALKVGDPAPQFSAVDGNWRPVSLRQLRGKVVLISAVPSLDTGVCAVQTKRFNQRAALFPDTVVLVTISQDLPFAQQRFCVAERIDRLRVWSDHVGREFGFRYGVMIKDLMLLSRAVFVIGADGKIRHLEIVSELAHEPDYKAALTAVQQAIGGR